MAETIPDILANPGPHTPASLAERLPFLSRDAIENALEALSAQGVLARAVGTDGSPEYRLVAPDRYVQAGMDVVRDPGRLDAGRRR